MFIWLAQCFLLFGYTAVNNTFPTPLTAIEEQKYLQLYAEGNFEARNILIERNMRLVAHIAKKYSNARDCEDFISIGAIGLIKAIASFDASRGTRLATFAARCIENAMVA